ncbi:hypothetical protein H6P81_002530 [Aristolochia fimbriata]|uniref:SAM domain-containing protein n=1 Tax=Aristolochia fimbriata TaxID=158543 RepID=A0AAV7FD80_ARIFI|nr:hypothetical protein H6P81_002530 [Aristolochia fimbriata]
MTPIQTPAPSFPDNDDDDDDFQTPIPFTSLCRNENFRTMAKSSTQPSFQPLCPANAVRPSKKPKLTPALGKENIATLKTRCSKFSSLCGSGEKKGASSQGGYPLNSNEAPLLESESTARNEDDRDSGYRLNSNVARLLESESTEKIEDNGDDDADFEPGTQLKELMNLCAVVGGVDLHIQEANDVTREDITGTVDCPLCGTDISELNEELRQVHTNDCLDASGASTTIPSNNKKPSSPQQVGSANPVVDWLRNLGLSGYEEAFTKQEIDWDTLQWLTEEDLLSIGITPLGPRKKIVHALDELKKRNTNQNEISKVTSKTAIAESKKVVVTGNKLITEFFQGSSETNRTKDRGALSIPPQCGEKRPADSHPNRTSTRKCRSSGRFKAIPSWCCIPGTPFRVDAFQYLRGDCTYWFLTHFHIDHYQGLTRGFCHGKIYCSSITAHLVNAKLGVSWDKLQVLPLNQKICISGVDVTFMDANHCPGSVIIFFEPPNKKPVLHTGDFRYSEEMTSCAILQSCHIHTLILDTTYCNPQYDFPKQEAVIQFVIEAIQAETFNPTTLFLIGSYTIGKERLFLEVARFLRRKIYVGAAKLKLLKCLGISEEDMQWFTINERDSNIHVVPMWTIASFKRLKHLSNQYKAQFNVIVAFSPTGWTYGKGKKKTPGRRWQQGTIIRYEVPYSEHSSFSELREFVQFLSPEKIIPSVNNNGPESAEAMVTLLTSNP